MCDIVTHNWGVYFNVLSPLENLPRILNVHESVIHDSRYEWNSEKHGHYPNSGISIFQYTLSGCGAFDDGSVIHRLPAGTAFLTNADDKWYRYFYPGNSGEEHIVLWCNLQSFVSADLVSEINRRYGYIFQLPASSGSIAGLLSFKESGTDRSNMTASENSRLANELLQDLIWSREKMNMGTGETVLVERALSLIDSNDGMLYQAGELADILQVSREHLSRAFRKHLGTSPYSHIVARKIDLAKLRLRNSTRSVNQISRDLGFTSPVQFAKLFKKSSGISPGEYRKICRSGYSGL